MNSRKSILLAVTALFLLAIGGIAYLGSFTRMHADDFCIASSMASMGFFPSIVYWYNNWAGRYMYFVASHLISLTGPIGAAVFPLIVFTLLFLFLAWALLPVIRKANWPHPSLTALAGSGMIVLVLLCTAPNVFQSFMWRDGEINYSFPMIGVSLMAGIAVRAWLKPAWPTAVYAGLVLVLIMICGGFAETYSALQVGLLGVCFLLVLLFGRKENRIRLGWILGVGLVGAMIAFGFEYIAPGNFVRQQVLGPTSSLPQTIVYSVRGMFIFARDYVLLHRYWALAMMVCAFLAGWWLDPTPASPRLRIHPAMLWAQPWFRGLVLIPAGLAVVVIAACAPTAYAMSVYLADRSAAVPMFFLVSALIVCCALLGAGLRRLGWLPVPDAQPWLRLILPAAILVIVSWMSLSSFWNTIQQAPDFQSYAQSWDKRNVILLDGHRQGLTDITVVGLHNRFGIGDLRVEPNYWINGCMAGYYGYQAIRGR